MTRFKEAFYDFSSANKFFLITIFLDLKNPSIIYQMEIKVSTAQMIFLRKIINYFLIFFFSFCLIFSTNEMISIFWLKGGISTLSLWSNTPLALLNRYGDLIENFPALFYCRMNDNNGQYSQSINYSSVRDEIALIVDGA